jgi:hypothetical protein
MHLAAGGLRRPRSTNSCTGTGSTNNAGIVDTEAMRSRSQTCVSGGAEDRAAMATFDSNQQRALSEEDGSHRVADDTCNREHCALAINIPGWQP